MPYIGNDIQYGELNSQTFTGDGSTTAFTLNYTVSNVNSLLVTVADVIQEPTTAYTVSGTTLTFTSAPASSDTIHVRYLGRTLDVGTTAIVQDSDQDTKIQVEESADEDTIRFDTGGTERVTINSTSLTSTTPLYIPDGSASAPSVTNTGDTNTGIFFPAADTVGVAVGGTEVWRYGSNPTTAKNILINGACPVAQRGSQSSVASGYGAVDRWEMNSLGGASARYTLSQESGGGVGGNAKWAKVLVTTADASPGTNEAHYFGQKIEGFNAQSLLDDSGDLLASTMSFDVIVHADGASSISFPATLAICVNDNGFANQQYVKTFTVAAADTWERVSVPIAANTSIVINNDNTNQFQVAFTIYSGTGKETTDATWESAAGLDVSVSGVANLADATNNYLGITNVQLEVGSVSTDLEHEDYGTTLAKCQRYFWSVGDANNAHAYFIGFSYSTTLVLVYINYPVQMRAAPTVGGDGDWGQYVNGTSSYNGTGTNSTSMFKESGQLVLNGFSGIAAANIPGYIVYRGGKTVTFSAEL